MKTKFQALLCGAVLAAGVMLAPAVHAEEGTPPPKKERRERGDRLQQLREQLALTDAQVEQLKPILAAEREELQALRKETSADADKGAAREKMKAIRDKYKAQIEAVLTPEQKEKFAKLQERGPRQGGPGGHEGAPPPPPES